MRKTIFTILAISLLCLFFTGCSKDNQTDPYISFATTYMATYDEARDYAEYGTAVYEYDLQSKKISKIFEFPLSAMYSLGVYDKKTNSVYYSKEKDNDSYERLYTGDQIYCYNLKTDKDTMLTDDLSAVNCIVPVDGAVFFIADRQNKKLDNLSPLVLGKIDLSDGSIKYWDEDKTSQTRLISVDRISKRIYVAISDIEEEAHALEYHYSSADAPFIPPTHTIYSYDYNLSDRREILRKDNMVIKAIYAYDNKLLYSAASTMSPYPDTVIMTEILDLNNMEVMYQSEEQFSERGCFTQNAKGVYGLDLNKESGGIFYYDFDANESMMIIENNFGSNDYGVANFELMY